MSWPRLAVWTLGGYVALELLKKGWDAMTSKPPFPYVQVGSGLYLAKTAGEQFIAMRDAAQLHGVHLSISTAWRSTTYQQKLYNAYLAYKAGVGAWAPLAAKPGTSNHEKGIAIDLNGIDPTKANYDPKRRAWLIKYGPSFNWYFSVPSEPWHMAYGIKLEGPNPVFAVS